LVAAGTRAKVSIGEIKLLDAERADFFLVIVDELILLYA